jgi:hypothetical protein
MLGRNSRRVLSVGYSMVRRLSRLGPLVAGLGIVALLAAGCGSGPLTATPFLPASNPATASVGPSATASQPSPTATPTAGQTYPLAHVDAALEDKLPSVIGQVALTKWSMPVSSYIASVTGGDSVLYPTWLVKFGRTPDEVDMALAEDLTGHENANLRAIQVPGADPAALVAGLSDVATKTGWPNKTVTSLPKTPVLQITDPSVDATKGPNTAYVYAKGDIVYFVIGNPALDLVGIVQALAALP